MKNESMQERRFAMMRFEIQEHIASIIKHLESRGVFGPDQFFVLMQATDAVRELHGVVVKTTEIVNLGKPNSN